MKSEIKRLIERVALDPARSVVKKANDARLRENLSFAGQTASDAIKSLVEGTGPAMINRLGTRELVAIVSYRRIRAEHASHKAEDYSGLDKIA